jgi:Flp pilus assembly protein TadD
VWLGVALGLLLLGGGILFFVRPPRPERPRVAPPARDAASQSTDDEEFVGSESCAACHNRIWESYRRHPMGQSLATPREASPIENYETADFAPPGHRRYRVERTASGVRHHESLADGDGTLLYDQSVDVAYALGSGKRGRTYLIERDGMLFKSSIAWFSRENAWGLAPDYAPDSHKRFERRITDGCINCHAGRVHAPTSAPDTFAAPIMIEEAIGCERCHGPGRRHVEAHERSAGGKLRQEFIVNPARLEGSRQTAICAQCHLHGEATVLRTGQKPYDFRPGQRLEENRIVFVKPPLKAAASGRQALSQVEQMLNSACFRKSGGKLQCTSCHDPHGLPSAESRVEYYRLRCLACHETRTCGLPEEQRLARQPNDDCTACHMAPSLHLANILHVSFADHRILRDARSQPQEKQAEKWTAAELALFDRAEERLPKLDIDRAFAFVLVGGSAHTTPAPADARRAEQLLLPVYQSQPVDIDTLEILGTACLVQNRGADAAAWFQKALTLDPRREQSLLQLGLYYRQIRQLEPAAEYLQRFLAVNPWRGEIFAQYASVLALRGEWNECISAGARGLQQNPTLASLHELLAYACEQRGDLPDSEQHRKQFESLQRLLRPSGTPVPDDRSP